MQPVMKNIEAKYKGLVKVTFHDVWKDTKKSEEYGIELIPTQVFRDASGKEIMRHQGFFTEEEIDNFLQSQGVTIPQ
jgi:thioredoxin 1